ncbi:MAG: hypothetical protein RJB13_16 [Pseudomonadota bacterium]
MVEISTKTTSEENFSAGADLRNDARVTITETGTYTVLIQLGHQKFQAECVDYSPFGLGLRLPANLELPLISIGEPVDLECNFLGSKFNARGLIANTRIEATESGRFVRLGVALSRSAEVVRPSHVKRRSARIQISDSVAPLVCVADELRFGEMIFAKMTDVSQGGMRLLVDRSPLPFMEKQRHWFEVNLPFFGVSKAFCRIAYVVKDGVTQKYWVGCEFVDGGSEHDVRALQDWLFYAHNWLKRSDINAAGFPLNHIREIDETFRVSITTDELGLAGAALEAVSADNENFHKDGQVLDFVVTREEKACRMRFHYYPDLNSLNLRAVDQREFLLDHAVSFWKALILFSVYNAVKTIKLEKSAVESTCLNNSLNMSSSELQSGFAASELMTGAILKFSIWRKVMKDLSCRADLKIPPSQSFLRRLFLFS